MVADDPIKAAQEVGARIRDMAGDGLSQARKTYDEYSSATERTVNALESSFRQAWLGARDMNQRLMTFADANAKIGFDYAEKLAAATNPNDILTLQQEYFRVQAERVGHQMRELNELAARATRDAQEAAKVKA